MKCRICTNSKGNKQFKIREMMFGFRDSFTYFQCNKCGVLQISEIPKNMQKYYPKNYYSFENLKSNPVLKLIKNLRADYAILNKGMIGKVIYDTHPESALRSLSRIKLTKNSKILDVGSGRGVLLHQLKEIKFSNILGIDPYLDQDISYENDLKILKKDIFEVDEKWDLIMFHHSFEHLSDPTKVLQHVSEILSDGGTCILRIPVVTSYAWEHYGVNWAQIDAPRHFFLYSITGIQMMAEKAGLNIDEIVFDSTAFQFWGSEQYKRDISLMSEQSFAKNPSKSIFTKAQIKVFNRDAKALNEEKRGDQAIFYLKRNIPKNKRISYL